MPGCQGLAVPWPNPAIRYIVTGQPNGLKNPIRKITPGTAVPWPNPAIRPTERTYCQGLAVPWPNPAQIIARYKNYPL